jgi:hypothetical protein
VIPVRGPTGRRSRIPDARHGLASRATTEADRIAVVVARRLSTHIRMGEVAREVVALAVDLRADLLILGAPAPKVGIWRFLPHASTSRALARLANDAPCPVLIAEPPDHSPAIEPPCADCIAVRTASGGNVYWCAAHQVHHPHAHTYHFTRAHPYATHDSEVVPTGVDLEHR